MSLNLIHKKLGWPEPNQIFHPSGSGPSVHAQLVKKKIEQTITRSQKGVQVNLGILTPNPKANGTETPLAIVCEFNHPVGTEVLRAVHKLAWNFSRSPLLLFIEPHSIKAWTCCEDPSFNVEKYPDKPQISQFEFDPFKETFIQEEVARALHWVNLLSGEFIKNNEDRFKRKACADYTLLENLKDVREQLIESELSDDTTHDLLARLIFIQFLFHRKDSSGKPALHAVHLERLFNKHVLSKNYDSLESILENYKDSYAFFRWLSDKFNGDLFPGKGSNEVQREKEWEEEKKEVKPEHLKTLSEFVSGNMKMKTGQRSLWPHYQFDAIPLEFISSIYEIFVSKKQGAVYTPGHIVDYMLDKVLPWDSKEWDLKILDPASGSGIFLVKAFQRLIHRWKKAHKKKEIRTDGLKNILKNNLFGLDRDPHAIRVASFSLYLAMCDEIDPKHYWTAVKFPRLRGKSLICADFFDEDKKGFRTKEDASSYDLVIGNPPWGKDSIKGPAKDWANVKWTEHDFTDFQWEYANNDTGTLFLPKSAYLTKPKGQISLLQSAMGIIFNQLGTSTRFRKKFFLTFKVNEITNLSALRFGLFKEALSPACIVTFQPKSPDNGPISYICPKPQRTKEDDYRVIIEPENINLIYPNEAANENIVWTALMWGGRRDLAFIRKLSKFENVLTLEKKGVLKKRRGIDRGDREKEQTVILGKKILSSEKFPEGTFCFLDADELPINNDPTTDFRASTNFEAFDLPQLLLKRSLQKGSNRFQAAIIRSRNKNEGVLCSKSYVSLHVQKEDSKFLDAIWLALNSKLAVYYLLLSSGTFAAYIPSINVKDILSVPIPKSHKISIKEINSFDQADEQIKISFQFKESEWALIEDLFNYTLPDKDNTNSPGRERTRSISVSFGGGKEIYLKNYCNQFLKVLKAGFGDEKNVSATIFQDKETQPLPVRLVCIHFDKPKGGSVSIEKIISEKLLEQLIMLYKKSMTLPPPEIKGVFYQRIVKVYDSIQMQNKKVPSLFIIKPDQIRYWTRSTALRDADEVASDIFLWNQNNSILNG